MKNDFFEVEEIKEEKVVEAKKPVKEKEKKVAVLEETPLSTFMLNMNNLRRKAKILEMAYTQEQINEARKK